MKQITEQPSLARLFRQICYVPLLQSIFQKNWVSNTTKQYLSEQVTQAEQGHRGEICVVIENHLPIQTAYHQSPRMRALEVFSLERVWDTEENTGVLVYVNVCEHDLEIVADRGINKFVSPTQWQHLCDNAITGIKAKQEKESIAQLIHAIGDLLRQFYAEHDNTDKFGNELADQVLHLS